MDKETCNRLKKWLKKIENSGRKAVDEETSKYATIL